MAEKSVKQGSLKGRNEGQEELKERVAAPTRVQPTNASTNPSPSGEPHVGPPTEHHSGQLANSGHTGTTPVIKQDTGKRDIREPETPDREEEIREPDPEEQEAAAQSRKESRREAAIEENPARDDDQKSEEAA